MEQLKIQIQTTTGKGRSKILSIIAVVLLLIGITASFTHGFATKADDNPELLNLSKERSILKKKWMKIEFEHDSLFKNNLILKAQYFKIKDINESKRIMDFRLISKKRRSITHAFSFNGRNSFHYWLKVFGMSLTFFIVACYLAFKDALLHKKGLLKWYESKASISFIAVSLFWLYHSIFMTIKDFDNTTYILFILGVSFPLAYFIYHLVRRFFVIEKKHLENIQTLVSHVLNFTREDKEDEKWDTLEKVASNGR
jgi:hypothetical protein